MTLKFCARENLLVNARPGETLRVGMTIPRVNRTIDSSGAYPANPEPSEYEEDSAMGIYLMRRMMKNRKQPPLWPYDEHTARHCGHEFQAIEFKAGEWLAKPAPKPEKQTPKPARADRD